MLGHDFNIGSVKDFNSILQDDGVADAKFLSRTEFRANQTTLHSSFPSRQRLEHARASVQYHSLTDLRANIISSSTN